MRNRSAHISTLIILLFTAILSIFFVPTHDDLIISVCQPLREAVHGSLFYGNGRFLGNTAVRMFLNNTVLDIVLRAVCIGGCVVLSAVLVKGYHAKAISFSGILCLGIGFPISKQVFVWGHGFYNYVPPVFLLLLALFLLKRYEQMQKSVWRWVMLPLLFALTFSAQLFCENSTTINTLIMLVLLVAVLIKKRPLAGAVTAVFGSCIGALAMFLGPTLLGVGDKLSDYRSVETTLSGLLDTAVANAYEIVNTLVTSWGLWLGLSVAILLLAQKRKKHIHWIWKTVLIGFLPFAMLQNMIVRRALLLAIDGMFVVYLLCAGVILFRLLDKKTRDLLLGGLTLAAASMGQLLIINPIGPRCLFLTYTLLVAGILYVLPEAELQKSKLLFRGLAGLGCAVYALLLGLHIQAWNIHTVRMDYGRQQIREGKTDIEIINLPYEAMFQCPNYSYVYPYQFNQGNLEEMTFRYISYAEYLEKTN